MRTILAGVLCAAQAVALGAELAAWPVSPLERIWPDSAPGGAAPPAIEAEGARGEVVTAQLAVHAGADARVRLRSQELRGPGGARIGADAVRLFWERRIPITKNSPATPREELDRLVPCEVPDPF
ncbi:MAG TPA: hypothetical protein DCM87_19020, partial [Planctomycetes bacterium]|nr:hypothetical protein [Planctomycetota bacterium]